MNAAAAAKRTTQLTADITTPRARARAHTHVHHIAACATVFEMPWNSRPHTAHVMHIHFVRYVVCGADTVTFASGITAAIVVHDAATKAKKLKRKKQSKDPPGLLEQACPQPPAKKKKKKSQPNDHSPGGAHASDGHPAISNAGNEGGCVSVNTRV